MGMEIFMDVHAFGRILEENVAQRAAADVKNRARKITRVDTGRNRNSIRSDKVGFASFEVSANTPHSLAQEYGRPDLPNYTYTPYMRPAAMQVAEASNIQKIISAATKVALERSRKK